MDQNQDEPKSLLTNLRQHHVVQVHNPLGDNLTENYKGDFTWPVARSITQLDPMNRDPHIDTLRLRNDSHPTMKHVSQTITIPQGQSLKLPGDVAQVIVKHLVDEILMRQGHKATIGDPVMRRQIEEMVIVNIDDLRQQMGTQNISEQLDQQIRDLNKSEPAERGQDVAENAFAEARLNEGTEESTATGGSAKGGNPLATGQKATALK